MSQVPQDNTTSTQGEFGESEYGTRLDYSKPKYQDLWAFITFYLHVGVIIVGAIFFWSSVDVDDSDSDSDTYYDSDTESSFSTDDVDITGIIVALLASVIVGGLFGLLWLSCIRKFPETIIKAMLGVQICAWLLVAVVGFINDITALIMWGIIFTLALCLYTWCVWSRIAFAGVCLAIASKITQTYSGVVWLSFASVFMAFIWYFIWGMCAWAYVLSADGETNNVIVFLLLVSMYWGTQVCQNVSHTTTCGVAATWYFNSTDQLDKPSKKSFKRTMTTSFGSVAFGSLIVAVLQAIRAMVRSQRNGTLACIAVCILGCIERLMRWFNKYAFAQVAIYGTDFIESGKRTWDLFMNRGISALINDDLSGLALLGGGLLGFIVSAGVAVAVSYAFYDDAVILHVMLGFIGGFLGYLVVVIILMVVASGVVAIFVCFAEDPAAGLKNRPNEYQRLVDSSETCHTMANTYGGGAAGTGVPQQQQVVYTQQRPQQQYGQQPPQYAQQQQQGGYPQV